MNIDDLKNLIAKGDTGTAWAQMENHISQQLDIADQASKAAAEEAAKVHAAALAKKDEECAAAVASLTQTIAEKDDLLVALSDKADERFSALTTERDAAAARAKELEPYAPGYEEACQKAELATAQVEYDAATARLEAAKKALG